MERGNKTSHRGITRVNKAEMVVRVRVTGPNGKRKEAERRVQTTSVAEALRFQDQLRQELLAQLTAEDGMAPVVLGPVLTETLTDYAGRWVKHLRDTGRCRPHVLATRVHWLEQFVLPALGDVRVVDIRPQHLAAWMEWLGKRRRGNGASYRTATFHGAWSALRAMLRDAVVLAGLRADPTVGVRFHVRGLAARHKDVLTQEEVHALLGAAAEESPDIRAMMVLGFTTGMRFGELSALRWEDVDFANRLIRVQRSQVAGYVGTTKTGKVRTVPLAEAAHAVLLAHRGWQEELKVQGSGSGLVFPSRRGTHRFNSMLTRPLRRCAQRAGISKHVSAHTMRRTVNNLLRQSSGDIVARAVTGHATVAMTEHYSHVSASEKLSAQGEALGDLSRVLLAAWSKRGEAKGGSAEKGGKDNPSA